MKYLKKTIEFFIDYAKNKNGKCLSDCYKNGKTILEFQCQYGHIWKTKSTNISTSGSWCPHCNKNARDNIETFKKIAIERGGLCLSDTYVNSKTKLQFKCVLGHTWFVIPESVKNNKTWCPYCGDVISLTIDEMKKIAIERGGLCLSDTYVDNSTNLKWQCGKGHVWFAPANRIKSAKTWCMICGGSLKKTINEMHIAAEKRNGKCLSTEYIAAHDKLQWECEHGHKWFAPYNTIRNGSWCPVCSESKGEKIIRNYLFENKLLFEEQKRFKDCRNIYPLPFDFYLIEKNILIEYDGRLHYQSVEYYGGDEQLKHRQRLDNIKTNYCLNNKIKLIRIPYFVEKFEDFLISEINSCNNENKPIPLPLI